jgi:hypothetical protein
MAAKRALASPEAFVPWPALILGAIGALPPGRSAGTGAVRNPCPRPIAPMRLHLVTNAGRTLLSCTLVDVLLRDPPSA